MILTQHLADDPGGLAMRLIGPHPQIVHRIENPPLHRLQSVARVRQRAGDDHAHRVVEIRRTHLLDEGTRGLLRGGLFSNQAGAPEAIRCASC